MQSILIVDDDLVVRSHLTAVLRRAGYEVWAVSSGKEALQHYQTDPVAVVILDIVMPEMDGLETMQKLRRLDSNAKVIGISGMGAKFPTNYLEMGRRLGMNVTLEKPFTDAALLAAIASLFGDRPTTPRTEK